EARAQRRGTEASAPAPRTAYGDCSHFWSSPSRLTTREETPNDGRSGWTYDVVNRLPGVLHRRKPSRHSGEARLTCQGVSPPTGHDDVPAAAVGRRDRWRQRGRRASPRRRPDGLVRVEGVPSVQVRRSVHV